MDINYKVEGESAFYAPVGKLTVQTAPELEALIGELGPEVKRIDIDLAAVDYVASAGLRVMVATQKMLVARGGSLRLLNPLDDVYDVFEMTGLADILIIER